MDHRAVGELMTREVVRARPDMPFKEIVKLLAETDVTAVPVVDELDRPLGVVSDADVDETEGLRGIASRGHLLRIFLRRDDAIRDEINREVPEQTLGLAPEAVTVQVREGQVTLGGSVEFNRLIPIIERLCRSVAWSRSPSA